VYELGPFRLDPAAGVLTHGERPVALGARAVAVLSALVEQPNEYVRKRSLLDAAWPGVIVEESNLAVQISAIRRALAEVPGGDRWVETLARRGYRFVGPIAMVRGSRTIGAGSSTAASNLPASLTSFIGRGRELEEIKRLLPGKRLLTIVGVGGIGKTRIALQMAADVGDAYAEGVWLVQLGSLADAALVPTSVAQVLGVKEKLDVPVADALCAHLRQRELLLILDNCEHLLDACATLVATILRGAPEVTIFATSREPLHVAGEQVYPLQAMSLPDMSATIESIGRSEAVQLFVERAQRHQPSFELTSAHPAAVAQLCIHLDGIPLALELAAARVRTLSVEHINARLNDRFRLLTGGARSALPHQQTLRATLAWSFDLLDRPGRAVLRRLGVFAGGFTLEAAAAVVSDAEVDAASVTDVVAQLVERSLIVADVSDAGWRYHLLETTRAYALDKLEEAGETHDIERKHAQHVERQLEQASFDRQRMDDAQWAALYPAELDNIRGALEWAFGRDGDSALGILLAGFSGYWRALSLYVEGLRWVEAGLARVGPATPDADHALLWYSLSNLIGTSEPPRAAAAAERAVTLYRRIGDKAGLAQSMMLVGRMCCFMGRFEQAARTFAEAFPLLEQAGQPRALANYFRELGNLRMLTGDPPAARSYFEKAFELFRDSGSNSMALAMLLNLGDMTWLLGDLDGALARFQEAVALMRASPLVIHEMLGHCLLNLAGVHVERGEFDDALSAAKEGMPLCREAGQIWNKLDGLALRAASVGHVENAARLVGYIDAAFEQNQSPRQPNEVRARAQLQARLASEIAPDVLTKLLTEGARLDEDEACRLALVP